MRFLLWTFAGGTLGFLFPLVLMQFEKPGDATGDLVILTLPAGLLLGAISRIVYVVFFRKT